MNFFTVLYIQILNNNHKIKRIRELNIAQLILIKGESGVGWRHSVNFKEAGLNYKCLLRDEL